MNTNNDEEVILNTQENVDSSTTETDGSSEDEVEEYKSKLAKAEELANNYKIRAEKAEKRGKEHEGKPQATQSSNLNPMDIIALSKANIEAEDVAEVMEYARFKNISVIEALKSPAMTALLKVNGEMRVTAQATNTGGARRQTGKVSDETLLSNAAKGIMPDSDEDIARLLKARRA